MSGMRRSLARGEGIPDRLSLHFLPRGALILPSSGDAVQGSLPPERLNNLHFHPLKPVPHCLSEALSSDSCAALRTDAHLKRSEEA
jgi:hypothetical protein